MRHISVKGSFLKNLIKQICSFQFNKLAKKFMQLIPPTGQQGTNLFV